MHDEGDGEHATMRGSIPPISTPFVSSCRAINTESVPPVSPSLLPEISVRDGGNAVRNSPARGLATGPSNYCSLMFGQYGMDFLPPAL